MGYEQTIDPACTHNDLQDMRRGSPIREHQRAYEDTSTRDHQVIPDEAVSAEEHAAKVNRATNDPQRIEKRKAIPPAFTVPRHRD